MCKWTYLFYVWSCGEVYVESRSNLPEPRAWHTFSVLLLSCSASVQLGRALRNSSHVDMQRDREEPHTAFGFLLHTMKKWERWSILMLLFRKNAYSETRAGMVYFRLLACNLYFTKLQILQLSYSYFPKLVVVFEYGCISVFKMNSGWFFSVVEFR